MNPDSKIFIAGHNGLAGSAIVKELNGAGYKNILTQDRKDLDLANQDQVMNWFRYLEPEYVVLAAAKVGGIYANKTYPADFIFSNLQIQTNVIEAARRYGVKRLIFLGSSCIYPKMCPQPMCEEHLLSGYLEPSNKAYAIAKIAGIEMCRAYNQQFRTNFISLMPTNLYGPNDTYDEMNSHVLPAMIMKFHRACETEQKEIVLWGSGAPKREFLFSYDLGRAVVKVLEEPNPPDLINVGSGIEVSIKELAETVAEVVGFAGQIRWDSSMPDGTPRKLLNCEKILAMGWRPWMVLRHGLEIAYEDFLEQPEFQDAVASIQGLRASLTSK